jgi:subtilisin family serine protease
MRNLIIILFNISAALAAQSTAPYLALVNTHFTPPAHVHMGSRIGNIVTLYCTPQQAQALQQNPDIKYIQAAGKISPNLARVIPDLRADSVYQKNALKMGYTGKGVLIGVTDWGFDYSHPMFYDTGLNQTRILAAWDQFKTSGPHPAGYTYGTEYTGAAQLLAAQKDTYNIYQYATHGSHVAGIAGGGGAGTANRGVAYDANFLFVTFQVNEAAVLDGFAWMKAKADLLNMPLVINMSWGLYHFGTLDGTSLLSQAIDEYSKKGVVFVTSGGNNGDVNFHIKKTFSTDTMHSLVQFYPYSAHPAMWGQSISMWGTPDQPFSSQIEVYDAAGNKLGESPAMFTQTKTYLNSFFVIGPDTIFYNNKIDPAFVLNQRPHQRLRIKNTNTSLRIALKSWAAAGTVHYWNVTELTNDVGNWGQALSAWKPGWAAGDNTHGIGEPACTKSVITVAAHSSEFKNALGNIVGGQLANFSSIGPTLDGRTKPDISAPGVSVASSISSYTSNSFTATETITFQGRNYPFARFSGTSMSSPATAGVVALMLQAHPKISAAQIKDILQTTARFDKNTGIIGDTGSVMWGRGKVNAYAAVQAAEALNIPLSPGSLYPNPSSHFIYYNGTAGKVYPANIYNPTGSLVLSGTLGQNQGIDISKLSPGLYFVEINGDSAGVKRLMVL